jgi:hypothetical protein
LRYVCDSGVASKDKIWRFEFRNFFCRAVNFLIAKIQLESRPEGADGLGADRMNQRASHTWR